MHRGTVLLFEPVDVLHLLAEVRVSSLREENCTHLIASVGKNMLHSLKFRRTRGRWCKYGIVWKVFSLFIYTGAYEYRKRGSAHRSMGVG